MKSTLVYGIHSALRRTKLNIPAYAAFTITSILSFQAMTLNQIAAKQFSATTGISQLTEVSLAVNTMFILGISVCIIQIVLVVLRLIKDRHEELQLLSSLGWPIPAILFTVTIEYCIHVLIGTVPAAVVCMVLTALTAPLLSAHKGTSASSFAVAFAWAIAIPLIATLLIAGLYAGCCVQEEH